MGVVSKPLEVLGTVLASHIEKIEHYKQALTLLSWDARTIAPIKGAGQGSRVRGTLSAELRRLQTEPEFGQRLEEALSKAEPGSLTHRIAAIHLKDFKRWSAIPAEAYAEFVLEQGRTQAAWTEARKAGDFAAVVPHLEKIFESSALFAAYWGYENDVYDPLVQQFDPDLDGATLDRVFGELKDALLPLIRRVTEAALQPDTSIFEREFPLDQQRELGIELLREIGYDFDAGSFGSTVHPFSSAINPNDARLAAKFIENDVRVSLWSALHEGGHSLYTQHIDPSLINTGLGIFTSFGIHESQSIFFEKLLGRHPGFWQQNYAILQRIRPETFANVPFDDFYFALNAVKPSVNRFEADELTYNLHLIIRYELERAILSGEAKVGDLPKLWDDKYEEYLGIRPRNHREGVLQDSHWGAGFGLFPSYTLGFVYAAQFEEALRLDLPDYDGHIERGEIDRIQEWLTEHIQRHGSAKSANELLRDVTGGGIDTAPLIRYLTKKYEGLYELR